MLNETITTTLLTTTTNSAMWYNYTGLVVGGIGLCLMGGEIVRLGMRAVKCYRNKHNGSISVNDLPTNDVVLDLAIPLAPPPSPDQACLNLDIDKISCISTGFTPQINITNLDETNIYLPEIRAAGQINSNPSVTTQVYRTR